MGGEAPPDPFARLLDDHGDFADKLTELEATLDEMVALREASDANREGLDEAIRFFEGGGPPRTWPSGPKPSCRCSRRRSAVSAPSSMSLRTSTTRSGGRSKSSVRRGRTSSGPRIHGPRSKK